MKCRICGKPLTGEGSFLGIGPVCRKHRAEAMQLHLDDLKPSTITAEDLETMDPYEDEPQQNTGKSTNGGEPIEIIDFDLIRKKD